MKRNPIATRIIAGVLPAMALFATPALAQEAAQPAPPTTPPVAEPAAPATAPVAEAPAPTPAPVAATPAGPSDADRAKVAASAAAATGTSAAADEAAAPAARATRATAPRAATRTATPRAVAEPAAQAPVAAAPVPAASPSVAPAAPVAEPVAATVTPVAATETTTEMQTTTGVPTWAWVLGGLVAIGLAALAVMGLRRRREENVWADEPVYHDEVIDQPETVRPAAAPVAAAAGATAAPMTARAPTPVQSSAEHVEVVSPPAEDVAAITEAAAPVAGRPWIELSLRPVRAGSTDDTATVDLELTLANAGEVAARDVQVSTFMLGDGETATSDMERLLASAPMSDRIDAGDIGAGQGSRVDATLSTPREGLEGATFQPIVIADVRYTLPDGGQGRTAAAFAVGVDDGTEAPTPLRLGGDMREDVAATLHGVLERA